MEKELAGLGYSGKYFLKIDLGGLLLDVSPECLMSFTMVESVIMLLPTVKIEIVDRTGLVLPILIKSKQSLSIILSSYSKPLKFVVYKFFKKSVALHQSVDFITIYAVLDIENIFEVKSRSFGGVRISDAVKYIAENDFKLLRDDYDIEETKDFLSLYQPLCSNLQFLNIMAREARGYKEGGFVSFFRTDKFLYFRSLSSFLKQNPIRKYIEGRYVKFDKETDREILDHKISSNSAFFQEIGGRGEILYYFDYLDGKFKKEEIRADSLNKESRVKYFYMDQDDVGGVRSHYVGSLIYDVDKNLYRSRLKSDVSYKTEEFVRLELLVEGEPDIHAGSVVEVVLGKSSTSMNDLYSGVWFVERAIHYVKGMYYTKLILIRPGLLKVDEELRQAKVGANV